MLGVNDSGVAVGFYTDNNGKDHRYEFNILIHRFAQVAVLGAVSLTTAAWATTTTNGVNDFGDLVCFYLYLDGNGNTDGMLATPH